MLIIVATVFTALLFNCPASQRYIWGLVRDIRDLSPTRNEVDDLEVDVSESCEKEARGAVSKFSSWRGKRPGLETVCLNSSRKMSKEALRTQLDQLRWEKDRLEAENARLKSDKPDQATISAALAEVEQY